MNDNDIRACLRFGWTVLAAFMVTGLALESLHLVKAPLYLEVRIRRELWTLAHAHGGLMAIITIAFAHSAARLMKEDKRRHRAALAMRIGALAVPLGFFFGGIGNAETDPSLAILLVPAGTLLVLHAVVSLALAAWRS